ncbi:hypothetical protein A3744_15835, partial [Oleiphilus sp. HI0073]
MNVPLFPLNAVLCPGGKLPLRVFEPRYLDMIKNCLKSDSGFVVVLLKSDSPESFGLPFYEQGTLAKIVDFDAGSDGVLHIIAEGRRAIRIVNADLAEDGLWRAEVSEVGYPEEVAQNVPVPDKYEELRQVLKALVQHPSVNDLNLMIDFEDSQQVGFRLTELLPLENPQKQYLFELDDPIYRLQKISDQLA